MPTDHVARHRTAGNHPEVFYPQHPTQQQLPQQHHRGNHMAGMQQAPPGKKLNFDGEGQFGFFFLFYGVKL